MVYPYLLVGWNVFENLVSAVCIISKIEFGGLEILNFSLCRLEVTCTLHNLMNVSNVSFLFTGTVCQCYNRYKWDTTELCKFS